MFISKGAARYNFDLWNEWCLRYVVGYNCTESTISVRTRHQKPGKVKNLTPIVWSSRFWNSCPASLHSSRDYPAQPESQLASLIIRTSPLHLYRRRLRAPKGRARQNNTWLWNCWNCFLVSDCKPGRIKTRNCFPCNLTARSKSLEGRLQSTHSFLDSGGLQYWTKEYSNAGRPD